MYLSFYLVFICVCYLCEWYKKWIGIVGRKAANATNPEYFDDGNSKGHLSQPAPSHESDYYNNDFGQQPPKRIDSAATTKNKRSVVNESAV